MYNLMSYITVSVAQFENSTDIIGTVWAKRGEAIYNETITFHGSKEFLNDDDRLKLFAHKLQTYAMELLEEEE